MRQRFGGNRRQLRVVQRVNQRMNVVTALHGAQQFNRFFGGYQRRGRFAFSHRGKETRFNVGGFINAGWDTVDQQIGQEFFFTRWRVFQQFNQRGHLGSI